MPEKAIMKKRTRRLDDASVSKPGMDYWRVDRVARYLDVSRKRVYQLVQEKKLDAIRLGPRQMRIVRDSLETYIKLLMEKEAESWEWGEENPHARTR